MTNEELFDAYRQVVSQRDQLASAGDQMWSELTRLSLDGADDRHAARWEALRGIGDEPPLEEWSEC